MNLLAIDTATEACTVGLQLGSDRYESVVYERQHAERLLQEIQQLLAQTGIALGQLDGFVWGRGPGMFTGLRIGAGVVQGLAYAADRPVATVSSLAAIAAGQEHGLVIAAIDARMGQVYWAAYRSSATGVVVLSDEQVTDPVAVGEGLNGQFIGAGSGWDQHSESMSNAMGDRLVRWIPGQYPGSGGLLDLGQAAFDAGDTVTAMDALPVYVRDKVAKKTGER